MNRFLNLALMLVVFLISACASTNLIESPKTAFVPDSEEVKEPTVIWTSRTIGRDYDYLGVVKTRSWTYDGALDRLVDGAKELKADAIVDVHYEKVGFLSTFQAFAVKFK